MTSGGLVANRSDRGPAGRGWRGRPATASAGLAPVGSILSSMASLPAPACSICRSHVAGSGPRSGGASPSLERGDQGTDRGGILRAWRCCGVARRHGLLPQHLESQGILGRFIGLWLQQIQLLVGEFLVSDVTAGPGPVSKKIPHLACDIPRDQYRTFPFDIPDDLRHRMLRTDRHQHMDVIRHQVILDSALLPSRHRQGLSRLS
jgi:hypothetical protein